MFLELVEFPLAIVFDDLRMKLNHEIFLDSQR